MLSGGVESVHALVCSSGGDGALQVSSVGLYARVCVRMCANSCARDRAVARTMKDIPPWAKNA